MFWKQPCPKKPNVCSWSAADTSETLASTRVVDGGNESKGKEGEVQILHHQATEARRSGSRRMPRRHRRCAAQGQWWRAGPPAPAWLRKVWITAPAASAHDQTDIRFPPKKNLKQSTNLHKLQLVYMEKQKPAE